MCCIRSAIVAVAAQVETSAVTRRLIIEVAPMDQLAEAVARLDLQAPIVLGLPPGGLLTASRVARVLQAPLDMLLPRHADAPARPAPDIVWPALAGRSAVIVDDGSADPLDWHAALASLRPLRPDCLVIVVPALIPAIERALANEYEHLFGRLAFATGPAEPVAVPIESRPARRPIGVRAWRGRRVSA
jgi:predicted phosphoribosyltransferase